MRIPAACCGVFGLKPTFGRVSRQGVMPARSTLDCVGPLARDMDSLIAAMHAIAPTFTTPKLPHSLTIGVVGVAACAPVQVAVSQALARCGWPLASTQSTARPARLASISNFASLKSALQQMMRCHPAPS